MTVLYVRFGEVLADRSTGPYQTWKDRDKKCTYLWTDNEGRDGEVSSYEELLANFRKSTKVAKFLTIMDSGVTYLTYHYGLSMKDVHRPLLQAHEYWIHLELQTYGQTTPHESYSIPTSSIHKSKYLHALTPSGFIQVSHDHDFSRAHEPSGVMVTLVTDHLYTDLLFLVPHHQTGRYTCEQMEEIVQAAISNEKTSPPEDDVLTMTSRSIFGVPDFLERETLGLLDLERLIEAKRALLKNIQDKKSDSNRYELIGMVFAVRQLTEKIVQQADIWKSKSTSAN